MSDNRILSQEEINALLSGAVTEEPEPEPQGHDIHELLTTLEQDALGEIGNISLGNAATSLSVLLGQEVDITTPSVLALRRSDFKDMFPAPHVSIHVDYTDGFLGMNLLVLREDDAKIIADLMMGGGGNPQPEPLSELHLSAVQEAMNQMMGSAATSMSTLFNRLVNITPPGIQVMDVEGGDISEFSEEIIIGVSFRLKIGTLVDSSIIQLIPLSFAKEMVNILLGGAEEPISHSDEETGSISQVIEPISQDPIGEQEVTSQPVKSNQDSSAPFTFPSLSEGSPLNIYEGNLNLLKDIHLNVTVELGRSTKKINEILELRNGSIVELDKLAGEPVDILVNNKLIAKGEVVVMDENFAVRLTEILHQNVRLNTTLN